MIESLRVESFSIVEEVELELGPGLNVVTGETGTGKSIVLGALGLLAGGRAAADTVREGAERAVVEAVIRIDDMPALTRELEQGGFLPEASGLATGTDRGGEGAAGELVVHRSVSSAGRSRARVAGEAVPVATLARLFSGAIEISSQGSSQALLSSDLQGALLDESGGLEPLSQRVASGVAELRRQDRELDELRVRSEERARRQDFLAFQIGEIDEVALAEGEVDALASEQRQLAHADRLREEAAAACEALTGDVDGAAGDGGSARDRIAAALRAALAIESIAGADGLLAGLAERLRACEAEIVDAAADLERFQGGLEADPARLARVEERLAVIDGLRRKYGQDEAAIRGYRAEAEEELLGIETADARIDALVSERSALEAEVASAVRELSAGRAKAARKLERLVTGGLEGLALQGGRFEVALEPVPALEGLPSAASGAERAELRFTGSAGETPRPLRRAASGGELSRLFLAIRGALRRSGAGMVLVFDEIDTGIGGRVAERVGRALSELAGHHQVLCITHLPQIAAFADRHFRVHKQVRRQGRARRSVACVERIEGDERIEELARMAGGESVTEATRHHARALLDRGGR